MFKKLLGFLTAAEQDILEDILTAKAKTLSLFQEIIDSLIEIDNRLHEEATRLQTESLVIHNKLDLIAQEKSKIAANLDNLKRLS